MINDIIISLLQLFNDIYLSIIHPVLEDLLSLLEDFSSVQDDLASFFQGIYYVVGKDTVLYFLAAFLIILVVRLIFAIVNIVGQYVP